MQHLQNNLYHHEETVQRSITMPCDNSNCWCALVQRYTITRLRQLYVHAWSRMATL